MSTSKTFSNETSARYARAIFEVAIEKSEIDKIDNNINDFINLYNNRSEFKNIIKTTTKNK